MDELARQVAQVAVRLAALSEDGLRNDLQTLDDIEQLARRILNEVASARRSGGRATGETSGAWRVVPIRRQ